jgi:ubiquinone/menaquinone biosynthesis C-methylase UbiE
MISKINNPKITATVGDAHDLKFESNSIELIYMRNVIHYIDYPIKAFSEIYRCLKPGGYFLFSQVVPPENSLSEEYDWLVGRNIHYPTHFEIINWMKDFQIINESEFILGSQSIMNWLNNTCNDEREKEEIIDRHLKTSKRYQSLVNFSTSNNDILVDIKHFMILAVK